MLARLLFFSLLTIISFSLPANVLKPTIEYEVDLIRLIWSVAEDDAVQSFVVERSEEGGYFTAVEEISALYFNNPALDFRDKSYQILAGYPHSENP
ncbi:MAG: hypothetical protein AAFN10_10360, partial [Bacteroidota bacterium]